MSGLHTFRSVEDGDGDRRETQLRMERSGSRPISGRPTRAPRADGRSSLPPSSTAAARRQSASDHPMRRHHGFPQFNPQSSSYQISSKPTQILIF